VEQTDAPADGHRNRLLDGRRSSVKVGVDTDIVAYLLLGTEVFVDEVKTCFNAVSNPIAPARCSDR
jgi:hypothetical protein